MPFTTMQRTYNMGDRVGWYSMTSFKEIPASVALEKAKKLLRERHSISPDDEQAIGAFNVETQYQKNGESVYRHKRINLDCWCWNTSCRSYWRKQYNANCC